MKRTLEQLKLDCAESKRDATESLLREAKLLAAELARKSEVIMSLAKGGMSGSILNEFSFLEANLRRAKECMEKDAEIIRTQHAIERALETTNLSAEPEAVLSQVVCSNKLAEV